VDAPDDEPALALALLIELVAPAEEADVGSEQIERDADLGRVDDDGADGERTERSNVPALSAGRLDDKDAVPAGRGRLLDGVAGVDEGVERRVGAERELSQRDIVGDGRREMDHRDVERGVVGPGLLEDDERVVGLETADEEEAVERVLLELERDVAEVDVGQRPVGAELGATARRPAIDSEPVELAHIVLEQAVEAVVDGDGRVAARQAVADGLPGRGVHAAGGGTDAGEKAPQGQQPSGQPASRQRDETRWTIPMRMRSLTGLSLSWSSEDEAAKASSMSMNSASRSESAFLKSRSSIA